LEYLQKSLDILIKIYGEEHPSTATFYNNIGSVYKSQGKYEKALEYYQKSLHSRIKIYGEENPATATSYHNIGSVYKLQGKYEKALDHQKSLKFKIKDLWRRTF